jgi:AraC-like DNA-binding protein
MTIQDLAVQAERFLIAERSKPTPATPGLMVYRAYEPTEFEAVLYEPSVCLILQGQKLTTVGDQTLLLGEGQCVVIGHDLPVLSRITRASRRRPYLSVIVPLDLELLRNLGGVVGGIELNAELPRSLAVAPASDTLIDTVRRYLGLNHDPLETEVLAPLIRKELHFRLLRSSAGSMLRALAKRDSHASGVARAIQRLRDGFRETLQVTTLASSCGMSVSLFHRQFKAMTMTTPLQYQKDLRLAEAQRLLRAAGVSVSSAAFEVGYESPSQFSREYLRRFGRSPRADLQNA